jgi:hypothetical protein
MDRSGLAHIVCCRHLLQRLHNLGVALLHYCIIALLHYSLAGWLAGWLASASISEQVCAALWHPTTAAVKTGSRGLCYSVVVSGWNLASQVGGGAETLYYLYSTVQYSTVHTSLVYMHALVTARDTSAGWWMMRTFFDAPRCYSFIHHHHHDCDDECHGRIECIQTDAAAHPILGARSTPLGRGETAPLTSLESGRHRVCVWDCGHMSVSVSIVEPNAYTVHTYYMYLHTYVHDTWKSKWKI